MDQSGLNLFHSFTISNNDMFKINLVTHYREFARSFLVERSNIHKYKKKSSYSYAEITDWFYWRNVEFDLLARFNSKLFKVSSPWLDQSKIQNFDNFDKKIKNLYSWLNIFGLDRKKSLKKMNKIARVQFGFLLIW